LTGNRLRRGSPGHGRMRPRQVSRGTLEPRHGHARRSRDAVRRSLPVVPRRPRARAPSHRIRRPSPVGRGCRCALRGSAIGARGWGAPSPGRRRQRRRSRGHPSGRETGDPAR